MHSIFCRILEKPVCAILDGCNMLLHHLKHSAPSLFVSNAPKHSLLLKNNIKTIQQQSIKTPSTKKAQALKKPPRGVLKPFDIEKTFLPRVPRMQEIDYAYQSNAMSSIQNKRTCDLYGPGIMVAEPLKEPNWVFATDDLSDSLIEVRKVCPSDEKIPEFDEDSDLYNSGVLVPEPPNQYKFLLRLWGIYPYPVSPNEDG